MGEEEAPVTSSAAAMKRENSSGNTQQLFGKGRYKFWALAAILILAFWSMFTGTVTLKWSAGNLIHGGDGVDSTVHDDLDILEVEEREKVVRHMWDVYTHSRVIRLPKFWREAFEAAYEHLVSDDLGVRNAAVLEIAKMSVISLELESPTVQSKGTLESRKGFKQAKKTKEAGTTTKSTG